MKALLLAGLAVASSMVFAAPPGKQCGKLSPSDAVSAPLTITQIERQQMAELAESLKIRPDMPKVPFGFAYPDWVSFKAMFRRGDKIVQYSTDRRSWQHLAGEAGYALIRSGCVVTTFVTMRN